MFHLGSLMGSGGYYLWYRSYFGVDWLLVDAAGLYDEIGWVNAYAVQLIFFCSLCMAIGEGYANS